MRERARERERNGMLASKGEEREICSDHQSKEARHANLAAMRIGTAP